MGNEPEEGESHEVTVELQGGVSKAAFEEYKRRLRECLDQLAKLTDEANGRRLKVRWTRSAIVPRAPRQKPAC